MKLDTEWITALALVVIAVVAVLVFVSAWTNAGERQRQRQERYRVLEGQVHHILQAQGSLPIIRCGKTKP